MGWLRSAAVWALLLGVLAALLMAVSGSSDPWWFIAMMTVCGALFGLFWHHRDRVDAHEDAVLQRAARLPSSSGRAAAWVSQIRAGQRVKVRGAFVTLTAEGIEWTGLRKGSVRWSDVESVAPWTMSVGGVRSTRNVCVRANGKLSAITCFKRNFADVLATCSEMARSAR